MNRCKLPGFPVLAFCWIGLFALAPPTSGSEEAVDLFRAAPDKGLLEPYSYLTIEARRVELDAAVVEEGARRVRFPLSDGRLHEAYLTELEWRGRGDATWRGRMAEGGGRVIVTLKEGAFAGLILAPDGVYEIRQLPAGGQRLEKVDPELAPPCAGGIDPEEAGLVLPPAAGPPPVPPALERMDRAPTAGDNAASIDVLAVYTPRALARSGGSRPALVAHVQAAVDVANTAFRDSNVGTHLNLVEVAPVDYTEASDLSDDLLWLVQDPEVAALRDRVAADMVGMIVQSAGACGIGFVMRQATLEFAPYAYQVSSHLCAVLLMAYAHEHGHNMGLEHDPPNGPPPSQASFPWSFGHFVDGAFRTIMSYDSECNQGCFRTAHYSNPDVMEQGHPTGIAGQRDNARTLRTTAGFVANFRRRDGGGGGGAPAAPGSFAVELAGLDAVLSWEDIADDEEGYRVYRGAAGGGLAAIAELPADSNHFLDRGLAPETGYQYRVAAFSSRGEGRSGVVAVTTPAVLPVSVELLPLAAPPAPGTPVLLEARTTGPVVSARWSFGHGSLGYSSAPCGSDRICATHLFRQAGSHEVTVEVVGDLGQTAGDSTSLEVAGDTPVWSSEEAFIQSVIFGLRGDTGLFQSHCWSHNNGPEPAVVEYTYLPRGAGNPDPARRWLTLGPGESVSLPNVASTLFGESDTQGSIAVTALTPAGAAAPEVSTFCRSFVEILGRAGSFGQFVGEEKAAGWSAEPKVVTGVLLDGGFGSTLLAANLDDRPGRVEIELFDAQGQPVGEPAVYPLGRRTMRLRPLAQIFPGAAERPGPFTARFTSDGIRFAASATLLESGSEDQIFIAAREPDAANPLYVPRIATSESQFGAFLVSRLIARNNSGQPTELDFQLWRRGQNNLEPLTARRTIPGDGVLVVDDVVRELFDLETGVGALRIEWANGEGIAPRVVTYSLNESGAGGKRFGMLVDSRPAAGAAATQAIDFGAEQSDLFRADFGILNLRPGGTTVEVTLKEAGGQEVASTRFRLQAQQHLERNLEGIFRDVAIGEGSNWTVETRVVDGGPVITYLANTNVSGDIFFVPGQARDQP